MTAEILNQEDAFELSLVRQDLLSDAVFLIGTLISIGQNIKAEEEIINVEENQPAETISDFSDIVPFGLGLAPLVLFLIGTAIIAYTSTERLNRDKAEAGSNPDQSTINNIKGSEIVIFGQFIRITGYLISILGEKVKLANPA